MSKLVRVVPLAFLIISVLLIAGQQTNNNPQPHAPSGDPAKAEPLSGELFAWSANGPIQWVPPSEAGNSEFVFGQEGEEIYVSSFIPRSRSVRAMFPDADPETFRVAQKITSLVPREGYTLPYAKDKNRVYSFEVVDDEVGLHISVMLGVDPATFTPQN